jgi:hypothetical protein
MDDHATGGKMTPLQMFSKVQAHLLGQLEQSQNDAGECVYRGPNGTMCAIGCLIKDEHYRPEFEGTAFDFLEPIGAALSRSCGYESRLGLVGEYPYLDRALVDWQNIHDGFRPGRWKEKLLLAHEELVFEMNKDAKEGLNA